MIFQQIPISTIVNTEQVISRIKVNLKMYIAYKIEECLHPHILYFVFCSGKTQS